MTQAISAAITEYSANLPKVSSRLGAPLLLSQQIRYMKYSTRKMQIIIEI